MALGLASLVGVVLYMIGALRNHSWDYWYLSYNLLLAVIPLLLALWLVRLLRKRPWSNWLALLVSFLWILFLPNTFYIVTDFIHLVETPRVDIVQDVVMLMQFSFVGLAFGFLSIFMIHAEFIRRVSDKWAPPLVTVLLLLCSFAIYLGRDLRWNSWDIVTQPLGLLVDIFSRLVNPLAHPQTFIMTFSFFIMLATMYGVIWQASKLLALKK